MSNNNEKTLSRRKLLKGLAASGGVVIAGKSLPENWSRPVASGGFGDAASSRADQP